jgi:hypothetical protein
MKLNSVGKLGLNSPTRAFVQRHVVAAELERLGGRIEGGTVLEFGCELQIVVDEMRRQRLRLRRAE